MKTHNGLHVLQPGSRWPSGRYVELALLNIDLEGVAKKFGFSLNSGIETGLGSWRAVGLQLPSGITIELIDYLEKPLRAVELRVDGIVFSQEVIDEALKCLEIEQSSVTWKSPLIEK